MEDKTYGIKTHLVEEFKQFEISRHTVKMAFLNNCTLIINASDLRTRVVALNGVITTDTYMVASSIENHVDIRLAGSKSRIYKQAQFSRREYKFG